MASAAAMVAMAAWMSPIGGTTDSNGASNGCSPGRDTTSSETPDSAGDASSSSRLLLADRRGGGVMLEYYIGRGGY